MKVKSVWVDKRRSVLDNGRGHAAVVDLPTEKGGDNTAPSAVELAVMALAGCVTTIFTGVAPRRHTTFTKMEVTIDAEYPAGAPTVTSLKGTADIWSDQNETDVRNTFDITLRECPVGILFENAGLKVAWTVNVRKSQLLNPAIQA
jgi:putative redox protein